MWLLGLLCCLMLGNRMTGTASAKEKITDSTTVEALAADESAVTAESVTAADESVTETVEDDILFSGSGWYIDRYDCLHITGEISSFGWKGHEFNIRKVVAEPGASILNNGRKMFMDCIYLKSADLSKLDTSSVRDMSEMFSGCSALTTVNAGTWDTSQVLYFIDMFHNCSALSTLDVSQWDVSQALNIRGVFNGCSALTALDVSQWDTSSVMDMNCIFDDCSALTALNVSKWNTANVSDISSMFAGCKLLTTLDVSKWDTSKVKNMGSVFRGCSSLTKLDISNWTTLNVTNMRGMFNGCSALTTLDVSKWDTTNVTDMSGLFEDCSALKTLNVSRWDTTNVTSMRDMFNDCSALTTLDVSKWDTTNVTTMYRMFNTCLALTTLDVSKWDTTNVTEMRDMFRYCRSLRTLDFSGWDTSNVTNTEGMFSGCSSLTTLDFSKWDISKVSEMHNLLNVCDALHTVILPKKINEEMADALLACRPAWYDFKTGKMYSDVKALQEIAGPVTLVFRGADIRANNGWKGVLLKWTPVKGKPVTVYRKRVYIEVYGSNKSRFDLDDEWTELTTTTAGGYYDKSVTNGNSYLYFAVINQATTSQWKNAEVCQYVSAPTIRSVTNVSGGAKVSWSAVDMASGYFVYRKDTQAGTWHMIGSTQKNLTYTDTTVENGVVYYYAVKAFYKMGETYRSYSASSAAKNTVYVKNVFISAISNPRPGDFTVVHSINNQATGYQIAYSINSNMSGSKYVTQAGGSYTNIKATGLTKGKTYYVMVRPYKTVAGYTFYGAWSAKKTVTVTK